jgi:hypothetical protein
MPRVFNRTEAPALDWREDKALRKVQDRITEVERLLAEAKERLRAVHAPRLVDTKAAVERMELEVLAGEATDAALAVKQQEHLDARVADARDRIQIEKL